MPRVAQLSAASLVSLIMCAGLAYASTVPPVLTLVEEHESEPESEREFVEREQLLRQRSSALCDGQHSSKPCPSLARGSANHFRRTVPATSNASEAMQRNGLGAPLRL